MQQGQFLGFFSTAESVIDGDSGFSVRKIYWYVWDAGAHSVSVQKLDPDYNPVGPIMPLTRKEFEENFSEEPDLAVPPENLDQEVARFIAGDETREHRSSSSRRSGREGSVLAYSEAESSGPQKVGFGESQRPFNEEKPDLEEPVPEFERRELDRRKRLCRIAEEKVRTLFIRDLDAFLQGLPGAEGAFKEPLEVKADWLPEYKHMFSQLAVKLRKLKLYNRSIDYHSKALELAPTDYHIYFNLACVHYALGDLKSASYWLNQILAVAPDMELARRFLDYISERSAASSPGVAADPAVADAAEKKQNPAPQAPSKRTRRGSTTGVTRISDPLPRSARVAMTSRSSSSSSSSGSSNRS